MERMLVVVFDSAEKAFEASHALHRLDEDGMIAVYADVVVVKDADGATIVTTSKGAIPQATIGATVVGGLIGLLGGPVSLAVGAAGGLALGALTDFAKARVSSDFVGEVEKALGPGKVAVVAEIEEDFTGPVDAAMEALGGFVFRRALSDVADDEYDQEIAAIKADIAQTKAEHATSHADRRSRLQTRIGTLNGKLHQMLDRAKARRAVIQHQAAAKVAHLKAQAIDARHDIEARQAERIATVRTRYKEWLDQLESHANRQEEAMSELVAVGFKGDKYRASDVLNQQPGEMSS